MAAPVHTTPELQDPAVIADPATAATFVHRRGGRVLTYLRAVTTEDRALTAAGEAFADFRISRALHPDAEAEATTLLRATRRAATAHAENPYRPDGRARPARRIGACDAMPRMLVAWTEARLGEADVARLVTHLGDCPDCHALRDAFDRAERGYRAGEAAPLADHEVAAMAGAMAGAAPAPGDARAGSRTGAASHPTQAAGSSGPAESGGPTGSGSPTGPGAPTGPGGPTRSGGSTGSSSAAPVVPTSPAAPDEPGRRTAVPAAAEGRAVPVGRRTSIPDPPPRASATPRSSTPDPAPAGSDPGERRAVVGRRTAVPERPAAPVRAAEAPAADAARPSAVANGRAADPVAPTTSGPRERAPSSGPREVPSVPAAAERPATPTPSAPAAPATRSAGGADAGEDPFGPEALGYAVPRSGLPRPERRAPVPRVRRRRVARVASAAVAAAGAAAASVAATRNGGAEAGNDDPGSPETEPGTTSHGGAGMDRGPSSTPATSSWASEPVERVRGGAVEADASPGVPHTAADHDRPRAATGERPGTTGADEPSPAIDDAPTTTAPTPVDAREPTTPVAPATVDAGGPSRSVLPATINGGIAATGRRALETPLVRQLGVPAVLLLAVLIAALIAAGVFAGRQEETVAPITRPTIPTVPADPADIPPLR